MQNFNQDISRWNTSKVDDMCQMSKSAEAFNIDLSKRNVRQVRTIKYIFVVPHRTIIAYRNGVSLLNNNEILRLEGFMVQHRVCRFGLPRYTLCIRP